MNEPLGANEDMKMNKLGIYVGIFCALASNASNAEEKGIQIHCTLSTRVIAGTLLSEIKPTQGYLGYTFEKYHATNEHQNYHLSGNNQEGFGSSALSWSSVQIAAQPGGQTKITAQGVFYDRATLVGKTDVEILLKKTSYTAVGGYSLISFKVNGIEHALKGRSHCLFE